MAMDLVIWYIRILYLFAAYEALGPKLTMIYEMVCPRGNKRERDRWPVVDEGRATDLHVLHSDHSVRLFDCLVVAADHRPAGSLDERQQ